MIDNKTTFLAAAEHSIKDKELRKKISVAAENHRNAFEEGKKQYSKLEIARQRAAFIRWKAIENLDKYLIEFEAAFIKRGGKVIWAQDAKEASDEILKIVNRFRDGGVVKSKSMITEEIGLNNALQKNNHEVVETDLGQYIIQITNDTPSHLIMPILHKSREEVIETYRSSNPKVETVEDVVEFTRNVLREKYKKASIGITGANFIIADSGAVSITENEGNAVLCAAMPVHIVVAGIDKVIPSLSDLDLFLPLLSTFGTGQQLSVYNSIISGPCGNEENSGPVEMFVVLVDNGRTKVITDEIQRQAMHCIHCGACMFCDPVYRIIGGHAYRNIYHGPFGSVMLTHKEDMKEYIHLSEAHPLDGSATESCPVNIDFNKLFLQNRKSAVEQQLTGKSEKWFYFFWKKAVLKRNRIKLTGIKTLGYFVNSIFNKSADGLREMHDPAKKSFNEQWREKLKL